MHLGVSEGVFEPVRQIGTNLYAATLNEHGDFPECGSADPNRAGIAIFHRQNGSDLRRTELSYFLHPPDPNVSVQYNHFLLFSHQCPQGQKADRI